MNNDCIRGFIFNNSTPIVCSRFSDFIGDAVCELSPGVYIEFWHDRFRNHGSWYNKRPQSFNEEGFLVEADEQNHSLIADFNGLVRFAKYKQILWKAAWKYYWGFNDSAIVVNNHSLKRSDTVGRFADGEYTVSYVQNGVNQIIGVRANSEEEAKEKFLAYKQRKGYNAEFVGVSYGFESKPGFPIIDEAIKDETSGYINLSYKLGNDYAGMLVRANSLSEATAKLHEKFPNAKVLGNYNATVEEVKHLTLMGTPVLDSDVKDGDIRPDVGNLGKYYTNGGAYRGFEILSSDDGLRKGVYRFYGFRSPGTVWFGNSAVDGTFTESDFTRLVNEGKIKLLDSTYVVVGKQFKNSSDSVLKITNVDGDNVSFSVYEKAQGTPTASKTLSADAFNTLLAISGYRAMDADLDLDETHAFDAAYNRFEKEMDKEYLQESIREMRRYVSNWSFMSASQKRNISPMGGLSALKQDLKFAEDRLKQLSMKDSKMFKVKDKKSGRVLLVKATDSVGALRKLRDALNFGVLAELLNKALDAATGKTISASGAFATAGANSVSIDVASTSDIPAVKQIVSSVLSANSEAASGLEVRSSAHEVIISL